jgi:hypothetical protein
MAKTIRKKKINNKPTFPANGTPTQSQSLNKAQPTSTPQTYDANKYIKGDLIRSALVGLFIIVVMILIYVFFD